MSEQPLPVIDQDPTDRLGDARSNLAMAQLEHFDTESLVAKGASPHHLAETNQALDTAQTEYQQALDADNKQKAAQG